jgi:hypothetical protein
MKFISSLHGIMLLSKAQQWGKHFYEVVFVRYFAYPKCDFIKAFISTQVQCYLAKIKEVCNGGVACSLLKLGSLEKTVIASLFHSGLHLSSPFFVEKTTLHDILPS